MNDSEHRWKQVIHQLDDEGLHRMKVMFWQAAGKCREAGDAEQSFINETIAEWCQEEQNRRE